MESELSLSCTSIDGIDALFIGRGDLAVAMGAVSPDAPEIRAAAERISAGRATGRKARNGFRRQQQGCARDARNWRERIHLLVRSRPDTPSGSPGTC